LVSIESYTLSQLSPYVTGYIASQKLPIMQKHRLIELQKIIVVRIGSLIEEVGIATNVKLNSLYIANLIDELESLRWTTRVIQWVLDRAVDGQRQLGVNRTTQLELDDIKKFENMLDDKLQELEIELEDSNSDREKEIMVNQIETLKCVLDHLFNLKYGEKVRAVEITEANDNFQQVKRLRKKLIMIQDGNLSKLHE
jgi:hypothetical protein